MILTKIFLQKLFFGRQSSIKINEDKNWIPCTNSFALMQIFSINKGKNLISFEIYILCNNKRDYLNKEHFLNQTLAFLND